MSAVVPLVEALDASRFGGKAAHLAEALVAGLPVPDGLALSVAAVEAVAAGDEGPLQAVAPLLPGPLAVRSSAVGEDGASSSFAGQLVTVLNVVDAAGLRAAVLAVHDSAHGATAAAYRARSGALTPARSGVVVQPLVPADVAGVAFTRDPLGSDHVVIEASWGLGEAVVGGYVTPDLFRVARNGRIVERVAGAKEALLMPAAGGGVEEVEAAGGLAGRLCLDDALVVAVAALALQCEQQFGGAQDIEWAVAGDRLVLLQSRPVTR